MTNLRHIYLFNTPHSPRRLAQRRLTMTLPSPTQEYAMNRIWNNEGIGEIEQAALSSRRRSNCIGCDCRSSGNAETTGRTGNDMQGESLTGNGEWTYRSRSGLGSDCPWALAFGGTHGAHRARQRRATSTSARRARLACWSTVADGALLKTIAHEFPEVHSMVHAAGER